MQPNELFAQIGDYLNILPNNKPKRIAINGIEGTGKTTFAQQLVAFLSIRYPQKHFFHISIDGFHQPRAIRYQQGRDSAKGYYEDSYDEQEFVEKVLLASQQTPAYFIPYSHDLLSDALLNPPPVYIQNDSVLITDGAYLFKPVYNPHWDCRIYLKTSFVVAAERGIRRDAAALGGEEAARAKFQQRYHAASQIYTQEHNPEEKADMVVDNTFLDNLLVLKPLPNQL